MFRILDINCCIIISEVMHMNDKAIRKILIEYLHLENPEARIYQEKLIGSSVCDVMSVSDSLTGYEIKSDCDNFQRLSRQIKSYTEFFDYNYLVVSDCHKDAASSKVPESWGIILIFRTTEFIYKEKLEGIKVSHFVSVCQFSGKLN